MTTNPAPQFAVINLTTGEIIDLVTFAREHIDPARQREVLRQAVASIRIELPRPGDALASELFAHPPEPE
jgi:hypothetical protein